MRRIRTDHLIYILAFLFVAILTCVPNPKEKIEIQPSQEQAKIKLNQSEQSKIAVDHPTSKIVQHLVNLPDIKAKELIEIKSKNAKTYFQMKKMHSLSPDEIEKLSALTPAEIKTIARKKVVTRLAGYLESKKP